MNRYYRHHKYLTECVRCNSTTTKRHAREHSGLCLRCVNTNTATHDTPSRNESILESGYQAYAREEGHYDEGDN